MYNNTIIQTSYKPYIPPPKKKISKEDGEKKPANQQQVIQPNNYSSPRGQQQSTDTYTKSNIQTPTSININQVLIDFNSTLQAIGASDDVETEVKTYLNLVETQSQKESPNKKMIVSNLKIAADVLDTYISETLKKPSKVVKEWINALLLQNIDYKADNNVTKGAFESITGEAPQTAKLAEKKLAAKAEQKQLEKEQQQEAVENEENNVNNAATLTLNEEVIQQSVNPNLEKITALITKSDEIKTSSPQQALKSLSEAFSLAQTSNDKQSMSEIYSKIASVQNSLNNLPQALDCLNASTVIAYSLGNDKLKTENHKQMGQIYDDAGYTDTAISHYYASLGIDGKLEDTDNQADTLNCVGKIYTQSYDTDIAIDYYKDALALAKVNENIDLMSQTFVNTATTFDKSGNPHKAMSNLKSAAILSQKSGNYESLSQIYEQAGDLMANINCQKRASDLYLKSYRLAEKISDNDTLPRLRKKLTSLN